MSTSRDPRRARASHRSTVGVVAAVLVVVLAGCAASTPTPVPDPAAACAGADVQRAPGFYPDLERLVPATLEGTAPSSLDSGRYCSAKMLGPIHAAGHEEVRFAGGTFAASSQSGTSLVVYAAPRLTADEVAAAFRAGSGTGRKIELVSDDPLVVAGREGRRIELINGSTRQVISIWPGRTAGEVRIIIAVDVSNAAIDRAVDAFDATGA